MMMPVALYNSATMNVEIARVQNNTRLRRRTGRSPHHEISTSTSYTYALATTALSPFDIVHRKPLKIFVVVDKTNDRREKVTQLGRGREKRGGREGWKPLDPTSYSAALRRYPTDGQLILAVVSCRCRRRR